MQPNPTDDDALAQGAPSTNGNPNPSAPSERSAGRAMPRRPDFPTARQRPPSFPWAVLIVLFLLGGFFVLLSFLSTGLLAPLAFVAIGIITVCGLHYLVWGWWLGAVIRREEDEEDV